MTNTENTKIKIGDFYSIILADETHAAFFCGRIFKLKGAYQYQLIPTDYKSKNKPTLELILDCHVYGRNLGGGQYWDAIYIKTQQPGIEKLWTDYPEKEPYFFGVYQILISRKEFVNIQNSFIYIGNLNIVEALAKQSSGGVYLGGNFLLYQNSFADIDAKIAAATSHKKYKIKTLLDSYAALD